MATAISLGCTISIPFGGSSRYDQIWDTGDSLLRVQIKTSRWKTKDHKAIIFNCYSVSNGKKHCYSNNEIDFYATYWNGICYLVPSMICHSEKVLWFEKPKQNATNYCMACDYEIQKVLSFTNQ